MQSNNLPCTSFEAITERLNFAVIGNPIAHSLSPYIHQRFAQITSQTLFYQKMLATHLNFENIVLSFFQQGGKGLNITAPFKEKAFELATLKKPRAQQAKSANTLWLQDELLCADNTDGVGFLRDLDTFFCLVDKRVLILGTGGAALGLLPVLQESNIAQLCIAGRDHRKGRFLQEAYPVSSYQPLSSLKGTFDLIINTTPLDFFSFERALVNLQLSRNVYCYDLCYAFLNQTTPFIQWANMHGYRGRDGLGMLVQQAAEAYFIWHGIKPPTEGIFHGM
ncbi:MAG: shikimate dehydrogenase [Legionella sp.]|nr:shikimate dehydrogenase [Legionella sp.]